jgi:hypothetical protein
LEGIRTGILIESNPLVTGSTGRFDAVLFHARELKDVPDIARSTSQRFIMISMAGSFNNKTVYIPLEGSLNNKIFCTLLV